MQLQPRNLPRIVLLDCADDVITSLRASGYDVEIGYTGYFAEHPTCEIPPGLREKDLLVVDLDPGWQPRPFEEVMPVEYKGYTAPPVADHARESRRNAEPLQGFAESLKRGGVILCLLEGHTAPPAVGEGPFRGGTFDWLPIRPPGASMYGTWLTTVEVGVDRYLSVPDHVVEELPALAQLLGSPVQDVTSLRTLVGVEPLLVNESGAAKAGVLNTRDGGLVMLLPHFKRKPAALHRLIGTVLPALRPDWFPVRESDWGNEDAYQMPEVQRIRQRRRALEAQHEQALADLERDKAAARVEQKLFTDLLRAHGEALHPVVRDVLSWLGFDVTDHDARQKESGGRLEEDLQVKDGAYFAVAEVTSARGNAKDKDFMDLEKYRTWRAKKPGRDDIDPGDIRGLLIVNQMHRDEPAKREPLFASSSDMDWPGHAAEVGITLVSTWELFKLLRAVAADHLTREQARSRLQQPGLLTFDETAIGAD